MNQASGKQMAIAMGINTMKAKIAELQNEKKEDEDDFFTKELRRMAADPENVAMKVAREIGIARASAFLESVTNPQRKDHFTNLNVFKTAYGMDSKRVEQDFINQVAEERGAREFERRDSSTYEANVLAMYKPTGRKLIDKNDFKKGFHPEIGITQMDLTMFNNFCAAVQDKWKNSGYRLDSKVIPEIAERYGMEPNLQVINFRELQLKP